MKAIKNFLGGLLLVIMFTAFENSLNKEKTVHKKEKRAVLYVLLLATALITTCFVGVMKAQGYVKPQAEVVPWEYLDATPWGLTEAVTICTQSNKPIILIKPNIPIMSELYNEIIAHENFHVRQYKAYPGGCWAVVDAIQKDQNLYILNEAEAYCSMMKPNESVRSISKFLANVYTRGKMTPDEVFSLINDKCIFWASGGGNYDPP